MWLLNHQLMRQLIAATVLRCFGLVINTKTMTQLERMSPK